MQEETTQEQYQRLSYLSQFGPTLALKEGIDINDLTRPDGAGKRFILVMEGKLFTFFFNSRCEGIYISIL